MSGAASEPGLICRKYVEMFSGSFVMTVSYRVTGIQSC